MDNSIITVRDIQTVTAEINVIKSNVQQTVLSGAIEIGRRLVEAKTMVPHGEWGKWLEHDAQISSRQAQRFIQLFDEYGSQQIGFFGNANPSLMSNMPYTKALKLLVIPEEEREAFVEENNVAEISNAELDKLIKERDAAKAALEAKEKEAEGLQKELQAVIKTDKDSLHEALFAQEKAARKADEAAKQMKEAEEAAKEAKDKLAAKEQELAELKANPQIPENTMKEIRAEAEKAAAAAEKAKLEKEMAALKDAAERAKAEERKAKERAEETAAKMDAIQKQLKIANPDVAVFTALFTQLQEAYNKLHGAYLKVAANDTATAEKLKTAKNAYLAKLMKEEW